MIRARFQILEGLIAAFVLIYIFAWLNPAFDNIITQLVGSGADPMLVLGTRIIPFVFLVGIILFFLRTTGSR